LLQVRHLFLSAAVFGVVLATTRPADAGLVVYTDLASFEAATSGLSDVNFNGIVAPGQFAGYAIPPGYTDPTTGTNFSFLNANGADINVTSATYYSTAFGGPVLPADVLNSSSVVPIGASESITLPANSTAFGIYFSTYDTSPITVTLSNGDTYIDNSPPGFGNFVFLGFTDTTLFSSLTITDPTDSGVLLADVKFGSSIPEPSSLALLGLSSLLLAGRRRRRQGALDNDRVSLTASGLMV
jgi:hypothetical protein